MVRQIIENMASSKQVKIKQLSVEVSCFLCIFRFRLRSFSQYIQDAWQALDESSPGIVPAQRNLNATSGLWIADG